MPKKKLETTYFVTNRQVMSEMAAPWFDDKQDSVDLRIGWSKLDLTLNPPVIDTVFVSPQTAQDDTDTPSGVRVVPEFSLFNELRETMRKDEANGGVPDTIIFIHGFSYTFPDTLTGLGQLKQRLDLGKFGNANMIVFTWPSDGKMIPYLSYLSDRRDAKISGDAGGRALLQFCSYLGKLRRDETCRGRIHIVAHSMGVYALRNAIQGLVKHLPERPGQLFEQVLLLAGDEDDDTLEKADKLEPLVKLCRRITVYYNTNDIALDISDYTKGNPRRLGARGPAGDVARSVVLVDASNISRWADGDRVYHHYYLRSAEMAADMAQTLKGLPEDKIAGRTPLPNRRASFRLKEAKKK